MAPAAHADQNVAPTSAKKRKFKSPVEQQAKQVAQLLATAFTVAVSSGVRNENKLVLPSVDKSRHHLVHLATKLGLTGVTTEQVNKALAKSYARSHKDLTKSTNGVRFKDRGVFLNCRFRKSEADFGKPECVAAVRPASPPPCVGPRNCFNLGHPPRGDSRLTRFLARKPSRRSASPHVPGARSRWFEDA